MITVIKEGDHLKILASTEVIPEHTPLRISISSEDSWDRAQLESEFRSDEDWGDTLNDLVIK